MFACALRCDSVSSESPLIDQHHKLRARIFAGRLGWNVNVQEDRESDEFDALLPTYILALGDDGTVAGCARLLPATGPTMLMQTFPQLLSAGDLGAHEGMIESSRFCVDTSREEGRGGRALHDVTLTMFAGIIEWSMASGYSEIVTATDVRFERILNRAGWPMHRLGW